MKYKIFILDEAHMITKDAWNAMLKTLEEPPPNTIFLLATTSPEVFPDTIHSRCQHLAFVRVDPDIIMHHLEQIAINEDVRADPKALMAIAKRSGGSVRDAITTMEQIATFGEGVVSLETAVEAFGGSGMQYVHPILKAVLKNDASDALQRVSKAAKAGIDLHTLANDVVTQCRHILIASVNQSLLDDDVEGPDREFAIECAKGISKKEVARTLRVFTGGLALAKQTGLPRLGLETAIVNGAIESGDYAALVRRLDLIERSIKITT